MVGTIKKQENAGLEMVQALLKCTYSKAVDPEEDFVTHLLRKDSVRVN